MYHKMKISSTSKTFGMSDISFNSFYCVLGLINHKSVKSDDFRIKKKRENQAHMSYSRQFIRFEKLLDPWCDLVNKTTLSMKYLILPSVLFCLI
jgi:hypothetical protein